MTHNDTTNHLENLTQHIKMPNGYPSLKRRSVDLNCHQKVTLSTARLVSLPHTVKVRLCSKKKQRNDACTTTSNSVLKRTSQTKRAKALHSAQAMLSVLPLQCLHNFVLGVSGTVASSPMSSEGSSNVVALQHNVLHPLEASFSSPLLASPYSAFAKRSAKPSMIAATGHWSLDGRDLITWRALEPAYPDMSPILFDMKRKYVWKNSKAPDDALKLLPGFSVDQNYTLTSTVKGKVKKNIAMRYVCSILLHYAWRIQKAYPEAVTRSLARASNSAVNELRRVHETLVPLAYTASGFPPLAQCLIHNDARITEAEELLTSITGAITSLNAIADKNFKFDLQKKKLSNPTSPQHSPPNSPLPSTSKARGRARRKSTRQNSSQRVTNNQQLNYSEGSYTRAVTRELVSQVAKQRDKLARLRSPTISVGTIKAIAGKVTAWCNTAKLLRPSFGSLCKDLQEIASNDAGPTVLPITRKKKCLQDCLTGPTRQFAVEEFAIKNRLKQKVNLWGANIPNLLDRRDQDAVFYGRCVARNAFHHLDCIQALVCELRRRRACNDDIIQTVVFLQGLAEQLQKHPMLPLDQDGQERNCCYQIADEETRHFISCISSSTTEDVVSALRLHTRYLIQFPSEICLHLSTLNSYSRLFNKTDPISLNTLRSLTGYYIELVDAENAVAQKIENVVTNLVS